MKSLLLIVATCLLVVSCANPVVGPTPGGGYDFLPVRAEKGTLFRYYHAKERSPWSRNWAGSLDLTGVSWNNNRTATLITRRHVVMAGHFIRPKNVPVVFHDRNGRPHERFITGVKNLREVGDIAVAKLHQELPEGVTHYSFARPDEAVPGRRVVVSDQTRTLSVHRISHISGRRVHFAYDPELSEVYRRNLISGDSGNPSFLVRPDGSLALLETHTTGGPGAGPFYGDPEVQAAIRQAIDELDR